MAKIFNVVEYFKEHPNIESEVKKLRDWLKLQPHLPERYITDLDLVLAYNCSNASPEITKNLLDVHYTFRTHNKIFQNFKYDENVKNALTYSLCTFLPEKRKDGFKCMYFRFINSDTKLYSVVDASKVFLISLEMAQYEDGPWSGFSAIVDLNYFTLAHIPKIDLVQIREILFFVQPFLSAEVMNGIQIKTDGNIDGLDLVNLDSIALKDDFLRKIRDFEDVFQNSRKKVVDETKRPGKPKTMNDLLGIQGSFKQLYID